MVRRFLGRFVTGHILAMPRWAFERSNKRSRMPRGSVAPGDLNPAEQ
jgi:hypothetical protein